MSGLVVVREEVDVLLLDLWKERKLVVAVFGMEVLLFVVFDLKNGAVEGVPLSASTEAGFAVIVEGGVPKLLTSHLSEVLSRDCN